MFLLDSRLSYGDAGLVALNFQPQTSSGEVSLQRFDVSMPARWFRMYAEFSTDPKVQILKEDIQRRYVMLLCLRCGNGDVTLQDEIVAFQLRITDAEWQCTKAELIQVGLITKDNKPTSWDKRQFSSDSSTARVYKHRDKVKRFSNVTVTPPETENREQRTEKIKTIAQQTPLSESRFGVFWESYPRKVGKPAARKAWNAIVGIENHSGEVLAGLSRWIPTWADPQFIPHPATFLNQRRWEDEPTITGGKIERRMESYEERAARETAIAADRVAEKFAKRLGVTIRKAN